MGAHLALCPQTGITILTNCFLCSSRLVMNFLVRTVLQRVSSLFSLPLIDVWAILCGALPASIDCLLPSLVRHFGRPCLHSASAKGPVLAVHGLLGGGRQLSDFECTQALPSGFITQLCRGRGSRLRRLQATGVS